MVCPAYSLAKAALLVLHDSDGPWALLSCCCHGLPSADAPVPSADAVVQPLYTLRLSLHVSLRRLLHPTEPAVPVCPPPSGLAAPQVLDPSSPAEDDLEHLDQLLSFLEAETAASTSFEFVQAVLRVVLAVHGDVMAAQPALLERAGRLRARLAASWRRVDRLMQSVRCTVGFLGNLQQA